MNPYDKLIARKRKWTPVAVEGGPVAVGTEDAISRCLALRVLEIPVGDFIKEATAKEIQSPLKKILSMNITDEENHDTALNYVADTYSVDAKATKEARKPCTSLDRSSRPSHCQSDGTGEIDILYYPPILQSFWKRRYEDNLC